MIQRNQAGYLHHESMPTDSIQPSDLDAFRRWINRRNEARKQIRRLSPRELEVVMLVADGLANKSIAQKLEISVKTIEKHRANASRKLGVGSTAELVRLAVESDLETEEPTVAHSDAAERAPLVGSQIPAIPRTSHEPAATQHPEVTATGTRY